MLVIHKYGGTSLKDSEGRECVYNNIIEDQKKGNDIILVCSAMGRKGEPYATKELISLVDEYEIKNLSDLDLLMSVGENLSIAQMSIILNSKGIKCKPMMGFQAGIITDNNFGSADIIDIDVNKIKSVMNDGYIPIIAGFQGITEAGDITTLGLEGSDTTAAYIAKYMNADEVYIYTDVDGVYTSDPNKDKNSKLIEKMSFDELINMSKHGAKVVHYKAPSILKETDIKLYVKNTFKNNIGTLVVKKV
jgi:aspartate kinase